MKLRLVISLTALVLIELLTLSGCAVSSHLQPPKISIVSVDMVSADVFSQRFRVHIHINNPNTLALSVKNIEYELFLQGDSFADGNTEQPFVIPALGESDFDTVINTHFTSSLMRLLGKLNDRDGNKVQYNYVGKVHLSKGLMRTIPFSEQGVVDLGIKK